MIDSFVSCIRKQFGGIFHIAALEWKNLFYSSKICILALLFIFVNIQIITPLVECSELMGERVAIMEPFVALSNSGIVMLILPLFFLTMMADFPKENGICMYVHIRCTRLTWVLGEILFIAMSSGTIVLITMFMGVLLLGGKGQISWEFSDAVTKYVSRFPERSGDYVVQLLPANLYNQMNLERVIVNSATFVFLYFCLLALILFFFTIMNKKVIGILVACMLIIVGSVLCAMRIKEMWYFPMAHTVTWLHYSEYLSEEVMPLKYSYGYLLVMICLLTVGCVCNRKRYQDM